jgi:hypothetical protein
MHPRCASRRRPISSGRRDTGSRRSTLRIIVKASTRTHQHRRDALYECCFHVFQAPDKDRTGPSKSDRFRRTMISHVDVGSDIHPPSQLRFRHWIREPRAPTMTNYVDAAYGGKPALAQLRRIWVSGLIAAGGNGNGFGGRCTWLTRAYLGRPIRFGAARRIRSVLSSVSNVCTRRWVAAEIGRPRGCRGRGL